MARLGNLTKVRTGKLDANAASPDGKYPFFTCSRETLRISSYQYDCECVLVAGNGDLNVKYYDGKFDAYQRTYIIESQDKSILFVPYLYYFLDGYVETLREQAIGGVIKYIKLGNLTEADIPLPNLEGQIKIVNRLQKLENLISLRKQQLAKLDELVKARFVEMLGDPIKNTLGLPTKTLGEVCLLKAGMTTSADAIFDYDIEHQIPCYGGNGIRGYVKESTQHGTYPIIGRQGALCGNVQLAQGDFHATEHAVLVSPLQQMNIYWLFFLLKYMDLYRYHTGAAQPGLAVKTLNTVDIPFADLASQDEFAALARKVNGQRLTIQQSLDKLMILKKSLMQEYFGGDRK